jgi:hypothetical protein
VISKEEVVAWVKKEYKGEVLITAGAGDIDTLVSSIGEIITKLKAQSPKPKAE